MDDLALSDLVSFLNDLRDSDCSKDEVIDAVIDYVEKIVWGCSDDYDEEYSFLDDEERVEDDEDDESV